MRGGIPPASRTMVLMVEFSCARFVMVSAAHLVLGKEWGISIRAVNRWANENLMPIFERGSKAE